MNHKKAFVWFDRITTRIAVNVIWAFIVVIYTIKKIIIPNKAFLWFDRITTRIAVNVVWAFIVVIYTIKKRIIPAMLCFLALMGLCAAGSDGPYFPWPNVAGLVLFLVAALIFKKIIQNEKHRIL